MSNFDPRNTDLRDLSADLGSDGLELAKGVTPVSFNRRRNELKRVLPVEMEVKGEKVKIRARNCSCYSVTTNGSAVARKREHRATNWTGLNLCESLWLCSMCGGRIRAQRAMLLDSILKAHTVAGREVILLTLTNSNGRDLELVETWEKLNKAYTGLMASLKRKGYLVDWGLIGKTRSPEETFGHKNGWHPHLHCLWFFDESLTASMEEIRSVVFQEWRKQCRNAGLGKPEEFAIGENGEKKGLGVNIQDGSKAAGYVTGTDIFDTEGMAGEVIFGISKNAKKGNFSIEQLLQEAVKGESWARSRFIEYAKASHRRRVITGLDVLSRIYSIWDITAEQLEEVLKAQGEIIINEVFEEDEVKRITCNNLQGDVLGWFDKGFSRAEIDALILKRTEGWVKPTGAK